MTPERYQQVKAIYQAAAECETAERRELLNKACGKDEELRRAVESLLADRNEAQTFLETPLYPNTLPMSRAEDPVSLAGQRVGPYKLLREIGQGGMGSVWLAARADDEFQKRVAIKLVKRGMDTEEILSRFKHERQILASLDHPNIARLLDGGTTAEGLPYFVMEYIEGMPIDAYCDANKLSTVERLKLFQTVCAAVQFAHQNLVVHRDLKPSNILVTQDGSVKLLDFGIAKILNPDLFPGVIAPTAIYERPMTPAYASPEQVRGITITTASDVYSLGVILYELLTGHRPYDITSASPQEIERVVCGVEPERPSTAIQRVVTVQNKAGETTATLSPEIVSRTREGQPEKLRKRLQGDLDTIVLMALRKEPNRRYTSVADFADDIRRHLEGLPVLARPDTLGYRFGKFVARNKKAVAAGAVFTLLLIGFLITTLVQSARIARERDRAQVERDKAEKVANFLVSLFKDSDPRETRRATISAREILDKGADRVMNELKNQPEVQATVMDAIASTYATMGVHDRAFSLYENALKIRRELFGETHPAVTESLDHLATHYWDKGELAEAEKLYRQNLELRRKVYGAEHLSVAESMNNLAVLLWKKGNYAESESFLKQALVQRRKLLGNEHLDVAHTMNNLAAVYYDQTRYDEAKPLLHEIIALRRKLLGNDHPDLGVSLNNLASIYREQGNYAEAEPMYREVVAIWRKVLGENHTDVAISLTNLGICLHAKGDLDEAEKIYQGALAIRRKGLSPTHADIGSSLAELGRLTLDRGKVEEGEKLLREALGILEKSLPKTHWRIQDANSAIGECLLARQQYAEAEPLLTESYQGLKKVRGEKNSRTILALNRVIKLYEAWKQPEKLAAYRALLPQ